MQQFKKAIWIVIFIAVVIGAGWFVVTNYPFVFRKSITGEVVDVKNLSTTIVAGRIIPAEAFSFAVAIRKKDGAIVTASSEDRQWSVVHPGMCVDATIDPYPPWNLDKSGTFFNARLLQQMDCASAAANQK